MDARRDAIDRKSYTPAYAQLAEILRHQISSGEFRPGDQLPSESQLCQKYNVSPMTVRRVINILADQGIVLTIQGRGTFVKPLELETASFSLHEFQSLFEDVEHTKVKLLEARIHTATERIARKLAVEPGRRIIFIRRLIFREGEPLLYHREHLIYDPTRPIVEAEMEVTSLYGLFAGRGTELKWGELSLEATLLTEEEARILHSEFQRPAFRLEHIFYDFTNHPISWGWFIFDGNRLRFTTTVGVKDEEGHVRE